VRRSEDVRSEDGKSEATTTSNLASSKWYVHCLLLFLVTSLIAVYNLFAPLSKALLDVKNKGFVLLYVLPSFGLDRTLRREASPLILLDPDTDVSLAGKAAMAAGANVPCLLSWSADPAQMEKERELNKHAAESLTLNLEELPPCLVFNCQFDVGLQSDGEKMSKALSNYTECEYVYVEKADHGSVCRTAKTHTAMVDFMFKNYKG